MAQGPEDPGARASRATCCTWTPTGRPTGTGRTCAGTRTRFPDPAGMLAELDGMGFKVCLWMNPYISHLSPALPPGRRSRIFPEKSGWRAPTSPTAGTAPTRPAASSTSPTPPPSPGSRGCSARCSGRASQVFKTDFAEGVPHDAVGVQRHDRHRPAQRLHAAVQRRRRRGHPGGRTGTAWSGRARRSWAASGTRPSGAATPTPATRRWAARCAAAWRTACRACRSGATTRAASPAARPTTCTSAGPSSARSPRCCACTAPPAGEPWEFPAVGGRGGGGAAAALPAHAVHLHGGRRGRPDRRADDAGAVRGPSGRPGRLAGRPGVSARPRPAGRADDLRPRQRGRCTCPRGRWVDYWTRRGAGRAARYARSPRRWTGSRCSSGTARSSRSPTPGGHRGRRLGDHPCRLRGRRRAVPRSTTSTARPSSTATRDGDTLHVTVAGPKRVAGRRVAPGGRRPGPGGHHLPGETMIKLRSAAAVARRRGTGAGRLRRHRASDGQQPAASGQPRVLKLWHYEGADSAMGKAWNEADQEVRGDPPRRDGEVRGEGLRADPEDGAAWCSTPTRRPTSWSTTRATPPPGCCPSRACSPT